MTRLLRAELLRLRSRRLTWLALAAVLLVVALTQVAVYTSVRPLTAEERVQAQADYEQARQEFEQNREQYEQGVEECVSSGIPREECAYEPKLEDFAQRSVTSFPEVARLVVTVTVVLTGLALLFLSASLVGAEFSSGSLANWLSFVPSRGRVWTSKLVALVAVGAVGTALATFVGLGATVVVARVAGAEVTGLGRVAGTGARGVLIGVIAVVLGFGLAMLTRHTIAAAGAVLGYLFVSFVLTILMGVLPGLQVLKRLLPENNALALLENGHRYVDFVNVRGPDGEYSYTQTPHLITFGQGTLYWTVVVAALLAVSYLVFRRRDVN